jgi:hypothetical protein
MKIKEGKELETTKGLIADFYDYKIDLENPNPKELELLGARFTTELREAVDLVSAKVESLPD